MTADLFEIIADLERAAFPLSEVIDDGCVLSVGGNRIADCDEVLIRQAKDAIDRAVRECVELFPSGIGNMVAAEREEHRRTKGSGGVR